MNFKLIINGSGARKLDESVIIEALANNLHEDEDYIILEPKSPIEYNIYLQVMRRVDGECYVLETRFVYPDGDYKHYTTITSDLEEVEKVFLDYYSKCSLPSVSSWETEGEDEEEFMSKLYRQVGDKIYYKEFWVDSEGLITQHSGELGDVGKTETIEVADNVSLYLDNLVIESKEQGYSEIEDLQEFIVQYVLEDDEDAAELLEIIESEIDEALGWTGNGHSEGGDIVENIVSVFCQVIDRDIALTFLLNVFEENGLLPGITISGSNLTTGEYEILYSANNLD